MSVPFVFFPSFSSRVNPSLQNISPSSTLTRSWRCHPLAIMAVSWQYFILGGLLGWYSISGMTWNDFWRLDWVTRVSNVNLVSKFDHLRLGSFESTNFVDLALKASAGYSSIVLTGLGSLFVLQRGTWIIGKNKKNGKLPLASYIVFWPFHAWNYFMVSLKRIWWRRDVADVSKICTNWYIGGWFSDCQSFGTWQAIVDLTTELPERASCKNYLNVPVWDGNPPGPEEIDYAANFIAQHARIGPTLCHCAAGIGRSSTVMCAALVCGGKAKNYKEALKLIQKARPIVRLNRKMVKALEEWEQLRIKNE